MANFIKGASLRELTLGAQVVKAGQTFPQGGPGTAAIFTVNGGLCLVTSLIGIVSTLLTTDPVLSLGTAPTTGTAQTAGVATTTVLTSAEVGTLLTVQASSGKPGALVVMATAAKAGNAIFPGADGFVVNAGTITQTATTAVGGAIDWYLTYVPITTGAAIS